MAAIPPGTPWADKPFSLVPTPSTSFPNETHSYVHVATQMANIHNVILRGLNAIVQQAPHVPEVGNPAYKPQDVADLLFFIRCWVELITHHHGLEEKFIFPEIEKFAGQPGLMGDSVHQHSLFHDGMVSLLAYVTNTKPGEYRWHGDGGMKHIIDSFSGALVEHLYAEIDVLLGLGHLDSVGLRKLWDQCEEHIKKDSPFGSMAYTIVPVLLGCADKTFEGGNEFPAAPKVLPYLMKYWFTRNTGAFRFSPCDFFSKPRPLLFKPIAVAES